MQFFNSLSLVLGLTLTAAATRVPARTTFQSTTQPSLQTHNKQLRPVNKSVLKIQEFLLTDFYVASFNNPSTSWNRTLNFVFTDPNSNTSTICSTFWTQAQSNTTAAGNSTNNSTSIYTPGDYVSCLGTSSPEAFEFRFNSFTNLGSFQLGLAHIWSDPADFPPPYDVVGYFAPSVDISLQCNSNGAGLTACTLPTAQSPIHGVITQLTN